MAKKPKKPLLYSPVGVFKYTHLNKADYGTDAYPKPDGEYSVTVAFDADDPALKAFQKQMQEYLDAAEEYGEEQFANVAPKVKAGYKKKGIDGPTVQPFFNDELDDEGDPTGRVLVKFKTKAQFENKDGDVIKKVVPFIDSLGEVIAAKKRPLIYAGSKGRIAFTVGHSFIQQGADVWVTGYLSQVQIAKLVSSSGGGSAFGALDGGEFTADDIEDEDDDVNGEDQDTGSDDEDDDEIPF